MKTKLFAFALWMVPTAAFAQQGAPGPAPRLTVEPRTISLSSARESGRQTVTIRNVGTAPLELRAVKLAPGSEGWQIASPVQPQTVLPGASLPVAIGFAPDGKRQQ